MVIQSSTTMSILMKKFGNFCVAVVVLLLFPQQQHVAGRMKSLHGLEPVYPKWPSFYNKLVKSVQKIELAIDAECLVLMQS